MRNHWAFALGVSLFAFALIFLYWRSEEHPEKVPHEQIVALARELKPLRSADLPGVIQLSTAAKRPVVLIAYASWCPVCRASIPVVQAARQDASFKKADLVMVSLDTNFPALSEYLITSRLAGTITPYVLKRSGVKSAKDVFKSIDSGFNGAIPYFAFIDKNGKLVAEHTGNLDKGQLSSYIKQLK